MLSYKTGTEFEPHETLLLSGKLYGGPTQN